MLCISVAVSLLLAPVVLVPSLLASSPTPPLQYRRSILAVAGTRLPSGGIGPLPKHTSKLPKVNTELESPMDP